MVTAEKVLQTSLRQREREIDTPMQGTCYLKTHSIPSFATKEHGKLWLYRLLLEKIQEGGLRPELRTIRKLPFPSKVRES